MEEKKKEMPILQESKGLSMRDPKLVSIQKIGFKREGEHIILESEYFIKGVKIYAENNVNKVMPETYTKHNISVPLANIEIHGENIYAYYIEILSHLKDVLYKFHDLSGEATYKDDVQKRINKSKSEESEKTNIISVENKKL
jgi:hypothetical protein